VPAGAVGLARALGNDSFEADAARAIEERARVGVYMLRIADDALASADERAQPRLPLDERQALQLLAIEAEQIKDEVHERALRLLARERVLQHLKARPPVGKHDRHFAVDQCVRCRQLTRGGDDIGKRCRPVFAVAADQGDASAANAAADAIAVVLNFVQPPGAGGWFSDQRGELRCVVGMRHGKRQ
jgi:hypothetical protein